MSATTITIDDLARFKKQVEASRAEASRAEGALQSVLGRLLKDFGCSTLEQAEARLAKLKTKAEKAEAKAIEALVAFEKKYESAEES